MNKFAAACFALIVGIAAHAQGFAIAPHAEPPPGDLADPIEALMATGGQRVRVGPITLDFWWVKTLPLTPESRGVSWAAVAEGTLVGAVTLSAPYPDARGQTVPPGIYTLRYAIQPRTDDGPGAAATGNVLLLGPVAEDDNTDPLGRDDAVALARQTPGASSPPAWRLETSGGAAESAQAAGGGQTAIAITLPVSREGADVGALAFDIVLAGPIPR
jgi:hypothetical protein